MDNKELIEFTQASYLDCEKYDELYLQLQRIILKYNCDQGHLALLKLEDSKRCFQEAVYHWAKKTPSP